VSPLPTPRGQQPKVVFLAATGHNVVLGTAGTGKSTMAMLRALHLARPTTTNNGPVLVVTYNNTLVTHLSYLVSETNAQVTVESYHLFARGYLNSLGLMSYGSIVPDSDRVEALVRTAIASVKNAVGEHTIFGQPVSWFVDEIHWISGMSVTSENEYQEKPRVGRRTPLVSGLPRSIAWAVYNEYRRVRADAGFTYDWDDLGGAVVLALEGDDRPRRYRHIIIDEGQDLWPADIRSLVNAVQPGGSLTFFGDYHQSIYGQGLSWRWTGIELGNRPVEKFRDNYRNTAQIARVAIAMAASEFMKADDDDLVEPRQPAAAGPVPTMVKCRSTEVEIEMVRNFARAASEDQKVAILARTWSQARWAVGELPHTELRKDMGTWDDEPGLYVGTYHAAKGLEFEAVFLPFLTDDSIPHYFVLQAYPEDEAYSREARLLYVSITRARSSLVMSYTGRLTPLLPPNDDLWVEETR
jgi:superfamily I DNA/RNA helicase